ncbi:hypothetical protein LLS1_20220 [Leifsonia sp. LS1]|uniref:DUF4129 domain-containing protein n=1 Tax=Leifsonia sp. LS1 TaxID=2828483 RepID=UPI001CFDBE6E|nr:DUF4129 domain-containing protein [Leifsonia sp. LS1]GIT80353.1 hypothetical protein LLS1_20220 [Leifsonia sp. LS1]
MSSKAAWQRWVVPGAGALLLAVAAVAVSSQGPPVFSGPRIGLSDADLGPRPGVTDAVTGTPGPRDTGRVVQVDLSWVVVALVALAAVLVLALVWRYLRRRMADRAAPSAPLLGAVTDGELPPAADEPRPEPVRRGLDRALAELDAPRDPRDAIERAWLGLEEGASDSGVRRLPAETPAEFVARVVARVAADATAARSLLGVYQRVRFGTRPATDADVADARAALESLRASWLATRAGARSQEAR